MVLFILFQIVRFKEVNNSMSREFELDQDQRSTVSWNWKPRPNSNQTQTKKYSSADEPKTKEAWENKNIINN